MNEALPALYHHHRSSDFFHWMAEALPRVVLVAPILHTDHKAHTRPLRLAYPWLCLTSA